MSRSLLILFLLSSIRLATGQLYSLELTGSEHPSITRWYHDQPEQQDSISWILARNSLIMNLHQEGYLLASVSQWDYRENHIVADIQPGSQIYWATLTFNALEFLPAHWVRDLDVSGTKVNYEAWKKNVAVVLKSAQSEGYLFANYRLNITGFTDDSLEAEVIFNPGLRILLDSIEIRGDAKVTERFIMNMIGKKRGQPVTPEDIFFIQQQLGNLGFVQQTAPPVLILRQEKAIIRTFLDNRNVSAFDALIGIQPPAPPATTVSINGYVKLDLINQLSRGERMYLHLERIRARSQKLDLRASFPYLLELPFGVEGQFNLFKNDTFYSDLIWKGGIAIPFGKNQFLRAGVSQQSTTVISVDKSSILSSKRLPPYIDLRVKGFTLGLIRTRLDRDLNPRKGYVIHIESSVSQKRIRENSLILDLNDIDTTFDYRSLYDSLRVPVSRIALTGALEYFIPWGSQSTIRLGVDAGGLESGNVLFTNELYRLGGYARLRGFDEESILAQYYAILSAEYRLLLGGLSYISLFTDYAWIRNDDVESPYVDHPYALGFGLNLETKAGIFGMRVAAGSQRGNPIDISKTRLHFGYVNRF